MKKKTSSPAPWKYKQTSIYDADGNFVCDVWGEDDDATDANGRLIEAAPGMKNMLEHYLMLLKQANAGDAVAECKLYEDMILIEDVLQKVEGE